MGSAVLRPKITGNSYVSVLKKKMEEAGVRVGDRIRGNILGAEVVELLRGRNSRFSVQFGSMRSFKVVRTILRGNGGGALPKRFEIKGLEVSHPGFYDLLNFEAVVRRDRVDIDLDGFSSTKEGW